MQSIFELTLPTTTFNTTVIPIEGGYKILFQWAPDNAVQITMNPCTTYPVISSSPNGTGGTNISIAFTDGSGSLLANIDKRAPKKKVA